MNKILFLFSVIFLIYNSTSGQVILSEKAKIKINNTSLSDKADPDILVISPANLKTTETFTSESESLPLAFKLLNGEPGVKIFINNTEVSPTSAGDIYLRQVLLIPNRANDLNVRIENNDKFVKEYQYSLVYIPKVRNNSSFAINPGKYYALIIGNSNYSRTEIPNLKRPVNDARAIREVLMTRYTFERDNIYTLYDMGKENVLISLEELSRKMTPDDNLLIFYAGHGKMDDEADIGYWLLSDADLSKKFTWLSNGLLTEYIKSMKAKHILLIADACYAGSIYDARGLEDAPASILDLYKSKSRKALTSGGTTEVSDNSKFSEYLIDFLKRNTDNYLSSNQLHNSIVKAVQNNSLTSPRWGVIQNVGDMGGDFIFILRSN